MAISAAFTVWKVDEYDPETYANYHGLDEQKGEKLSVFEILKHAPKVFWTLGLVEFFSWAGFQYLWTYGTGTVAGNIWHTTNAASGAFQAAGNWFGVLSASLHIWLDCWGCWICFVGHDWIKDDVSGCVCDVRYGLGNDECHPIHDFDQRFGRATRRNLHGLVQLMDLLPTNFCLSSIIRPLPTIG